MVQGEHKWGEFIKLPLGRLLERDIHQGLVELHQDDLVSIVYIMIAAIILIHTIYSHTKLSIPGYIYKVVSSSIDMWGIIKLINDSNI